MNETSERKTKRIQQLFDRIDQAIDSTSQRESNNEIEIDPSKSRLSVLVKCGEISASNLTDLPALLFELGDAYILMETPMGNTVLHIAAWCGNDCVVDEVAEKAPDLLFRFNKNEDTPLHVAARAGNARTAEKLFSTYANLQSQGIDLSKEEEKIKSQGIAKAWKEYKKRSQQKQEEEEDLSVEDYSAKINAKDLKELVKKKNIAQGNTMLHEAMLYSVLNFILLARAFEGYTQREGDETSLADSFYEYALTVANHENKTVLYLAVESGRLFVIERILDKCRRDIVLPMDTLSPVVAAIMKQEAGVLRIMLKDNNPDWVHILDQHERLPLHYAASTGFLRGVIGLLQSCERCSKRRDKNGYFPLHLASHGGHVEVVKVLLPYYPNPTEMLVDNSKRNILHIAAKSGKHEVVRSILQTATEHQDYEMMINQRDSKGDTPLHLATRYCHPKTVHCLTWDPRVDLGAINENKETALDIANALFQHNNKNASMRLQLVWIALKSAGVPSSNRVLPIKPKPSYSTPDEISPEMKLSNDKVGNNDGDHKVETLLIVSTLIITASVAARLAVPGEANGRANNLYHAMFQIFIICITVSLFSSISATILVFWARLELIELLAYSLKIIMPLLGVALISLSLAFMAGIYTVISELSWLATLFPVMAGIFVVVEFSLYILLFLPSSSTNKLLRYISYYPFIFLASLPESRNIQGTGFNLQVFLERASRK